MSNIDNILSALGDEFKGLAQQRAPDPKEIARDLPLRSLTGDHINGGTIYNFASRGITDKSTATQLSIDNDGVHVSNLTVDNLENLTVNGILKTKILEADEIRADIKFEKDTPIVFSGEQLDGKGLLWSGSGNTKQFIFAVNPDRFFVSENLDFARGKTITVNNVKLIDENSLGPTVTKSNLREVGQLNGLIVNGSVRIDQYVVYDSNTNRLGLGTDEPNAAFSVAEDGIEVVIGSKDSVRGFVGTYANHNLEIVTNDTARIIVNSNGNISLGNTKLAPVQVSVHGKMSIKVNNPDPEVDLHVNGPIKFNNRLQKYDKSYPTAGDYNDGDIIWNISPKMNTYVGWICIQAGSPGVWAPFGKIGNA